MTIDADGGVNHRGGALHPRRICLLAILVLAACSSESSAPDVQAARSTTTTEVSEVATTTAAPTSSSVLPTTSMPPVTTASPNFAVLAGQYVGPTGGSGNVTIGQDGSGRFTVPDLDACPSCSTASAPSLTVDFRLSDVAASAGGYRATGAATATSNPSSSIAVRTGTAVEATISVAGDLTLSFLPGITLKRTGAGTQTARGDTGPESFLSPSRNIGCRLSQASVRCDVREREFQPPPKPASCNLDWGNALGVTGQGAGQFRCVGDTAIGGVTTVLPYGSVARRGPFECRSAEVGMECVNLDTGHGIFVSRGEYKLS